MSKEQNEIFQNEELQQVEEPVKKKRNRRTRAQIAADKAAKEAEELIRVATEVPEEEKPEAPAEEPIPPVIDPVNDFEEFTPEFSQYAAAPGQQIEEDTFQDEQTPGKKKTRKKSSSKQADEVQHISGYMLLLAVDLIVPTALMFLIPKKKKGAQISQAEQKARLKLTPEEINELKPFAEAAAAQLNVNMSPVTLFIVFAGVMYAGKL